MTVFSVLAQALCIIMIMFGVLIIGAVFLSIFIDLIKMLRKDLNK